jgi:protein gp37
MSTEIQWTDETWNPVTGCDKVSPGCAHCYAEGVDNRFWAKQYPRVEFCAEQEPRPREFTDVWTHEDRLSQPLKWKKPRKIFVNSMSDLFHEDVPDAFIDQVFAVMSLASKHTFQVLTKRPRRMLAYLSKVGRRSDFEWARTAFQQHIEAYWSKSELLTAYAKTDAEWDAVYRAWPLPNVWLGVSVENQHFADERIPLLLQTPAAVRFLSCEPLLGPVSLRWLPAWNGMATKPRSETESVITDQLDGLRRLDWVIVGCESGRERRNQEAYEKQAYTLLAQCRAAGVAAFHKQMPIKGRVSGDVVEFPPDLQVREFPR